MKLLPIFLLIILAYVPMSAIADGDGHAHEETIAHQCETADSEVTISANG